MFIIAGIGSLIVWYLRKNLPELPRWLESQGRTAEAEALLQSIEKEVAGEKGAAGALPAPGFYGASVPQLTAASRCSEPPMLQRLLVGSWVLITINTLIFGFVIFLPQFFLRQGLTIANSLGCTLGACRGVARRLRARRSTCPIAIGRRWSIIPAHRLLTIITRLVLCAFQCRFRSRDRARPSAPMLIVAIYIQTAILFGVYTPELFPTEIRLRANGICNTLGRGATVISPFVVGSAAHHLRACRARFG